MKHLRIFVVAVVIFSKSWGQTTTENYIKTTKYKKAIQYGQRAYVDKSDKNVTVSYYDAMGRPEQTISIRKGGQLQDIVHYTEFDKIGRISLEYLPCISAETNGLKSNEAADCDDFYSSYYQDGYPFYARKKHIKSPLHRIEKTASPGKDWKMGNGNEQEFDYLLNDAQEVRLFEVSFSNQNTEEPQLTAVNNTYYAANSLVKNVYRDQNHSGTSKDHTWEEFIDKQGILILKRYYENEVPHDTYYVYDDYGNLTFVLTPKVNTTDGISTTELNELCYQYKYDKRNRVIQKKLPGRGWQSIVYNKLDYPILEQDANMAENDVWLFNKYDVMGRIAYTGIFSSDLGRANLQTNVDNTTVLWEKQQNSTITLDQKPLYYTNSTFPTAGILELHTINYYDDYVDRDGIDVPSAVFDQPITAETEGLPTVTKTRVLDNDAWITTVFGYDYKGREIFSATKNPFLYAMDITENQLDFTGNILQTRRSHQKGSSQELVIIDKFTYDEWDRVLTHEQCILEDGAMECGTPDSNLDSDMVYDIPITGTISKVVSNSVTLAPGFHFKATTTDSFSAKVTAVAHAELIAKNSYDELGKLIEKKVGNTVDQPLQVYDFRYNIMGWLKEINDVDNLVKAGQPEDLFALKINYNDPHDFGANENPKPLFTGNVSQTIWNTASINTTNHPVSKRYSYSYDALNRITSAVDNTGHYNLTNVDYDKNGNIQSLQRKGHTAVGGSGQVTSFFGAMDHLDYDYFNNGVGNRLYKVRDDGNDGYGFKDGSADNQDYWYDSNGNLTRDDNKHITAIEYNHFDLPTKITFSGSNMGTIDYVYDANGIKMEKIVNMGAVTEYVGNYVYSGNTSSTDLQFFNHAEGYVNVSGGHYNYVYQYKDHLGNIRLTYTDNPSNPGTPTIIEENNYYPFGGLHRGYNRAGDTALGSDIAQQWRFGGKEYDESLGLETYDFGARNYDPSLGRWMNIDPLAEKMRRHSPYNYAFNNPIYFIDPDGMLAGIFPWDDNKKNEEWHEEVSDWDEHYYDNDEWLNVGTRELTNNDLKVPITLGNYLECCKDKPVDLHTNDLANASVTDADNDLECCKDKPVDFHANDLASASVTVAGLVAVVDGPAPVADVPAGVILLGGLSGAALLQATEDFVNKYGPIINHFAKEAAGESAGAEHTKGKRNSTKGKHERGRARKAKDRGGEKGDAGRRYPRKRPPKWKGPWPPSN